MGPDVELIAHRAGNDPATVRRLAGEVDLVEVDLHAFRDRLEVRHAKVLWPTSRLWERWRVLPASHPRPSFAEVLAAVPPGAHLLLDLKGFTARVSRRALRQLGPEHQVTVSSKGWWLLRPFGRRGVRTVRSAGNRVELWLLLRVPVGRRVEGYGVHQRLLTAPVAGELRRRRPVLFAWGVTDRATAERLAGWGVTGLIIDDEALLAELRGPAGVGGAVTGAQAVPEGDTGHAQAGQGDDRPQQGVDDVVVAGEDDRRRHQQR